MTATTPMTTATTRRRAGAKVIGSVGIVAAAAAVAGLGTFGTFTDSTTPVTPQADSATVSLDLGQAAQSIAVPTVTGGWKPGDRTQFTMDLVNSGTAALSSVTMDVTPTQSSLLDQDTTKGLQLTVQDCSSAWATGTGAYTCGGTLTSLYAGPVITSRTLAAPTSLAAGGVDHLLATLALPVTAGNEFENAGSAFSAVFTGVQRAGTNR